MKSGTTYMIHPVFTNLAGNMRYDKGKYETKRKRTKKQFITGIFDVKKT